MKKEIAKFIKAHDALIRASHDLGKAVQPHLDAAVKEGTVEALMSLLQKLPKEWMGCRFVYEEIYKISNRLTSPEKPIQMADKSIQEINDIISKATDGATEGCTLKQAVQVLISQRDNARYFSELYQTELKKLGQEFHV